MAFENPNEDHPRRLNFRRLGPHSLKIEFIGVHEGTLHTQPYEYKRRQGQ